MPLRRWAPIAFAALCAATVVAITPAAATATRLPGKIDLRCATASLHQSADWYLPEGTPHGLVRLQHGFARTNASVASLAEILSNAGYLVVAPSPPFINLSGCPSPSTAFRPMDSTPSASGVPQ